MRENNTYISSVTDYNLVDSKPESPLFENMPEILRPNLAAGLLGVWNAGAKLEAM